MDKLILKGKQGGQMMPPAAPAMMPPAAPAMTPQWSPEFVANLSLGKERFVKRLDAGSRLIIAAINRCTKTSIAQLGDFTRGKSAGGFFSGAGQKVALPPAPKSAALALETLSAQLESHGSHAIEQFIKQFLAALYPQWNLVYLARALGLVHRNFDHLSHGRLIRSFADNVTPLPDDYIALPIVDRWGYFVRMDVLYQGAVFTAKCFKFTDRQGEIIFPFQPEEPGISWGTHLRCCPEVILTTDAAEFIDSGRTYAWLNDTGNLDKLDWGVLRGRRVLYLWHAEGLQTKNQFAAAMRFVATARKHGIEAAILRRTVQGDFPVAMADLVVQAHVYGLPIPAELNRPRYVLTAQDVAESIPQGVPCFWPQGPCTLFCGDGQKKLAVELLRAFTCGSHGFAFRPVAIIFPERAKLQARKMLRKISAPVLAISADILSDGSQLETMLCRNGIGAVFAIFAEDFRREEVNALCERCEALRIMMGFFTRSEDIPDCVDEALVDQRFLVTAPDGDVCVKDFENDTITRYSFGGDGTLSTSPGSEEDFLKAKEN